ncbi:MAG TPA: hypothetical protein DDZ68_08550 [Parvularcula sp.]|nr:hypothetical protein [Parvularcula sp.]HBS32780.1 hypothetical protein [Parvularcula sp.]
MQTSPRLGLAYIQPQQAQKHVTANESFRRLDALVQLSVKSATAPAQPAAPDEGDVYILPAASSGADWSLFPAGSIAAFQDGAWSAIAPRAGFSAFVEDEGALRVFDGTLWNAPAGGAASFGVNTTADTTNRLAVKSDAVLFHHDDVTPGGGGVQVKIDKAGPAGTASLLWQTAASTRAELGLVGSDDLVVKVSADGAAFKTALYIDKATANVGVGRTSAAFALDVQGNDPGLRLSESGAADLVVQYLNSLQSKIIHRAPGQALLDISVAVEDGVSQAKVRMFRDTATTGLASLDIHQANNSSALNHQFSANAATFIDRLALKTKVGGTAAPVCALDVEGPVKVKGYAKAALPAASAGAGQIAFVSDEAGGPVLAFSDGSTWRRVTDRAVVS